MNKIRVGAYERSRPERKPDPFATAIEARKAVLLGRYVPVSKREQSKLRRSLFWLARIWGK